MFENAPEYPAPRPVTPWIGPIRGFRFTVLCRYFPAGEEIRPEFFNNCLSLAPAPFLWRFSVLSRQLHAQGRFLCRRQIYSQVFFVAAETPLQTEVAFQPFRHRLVDHGPDDAHGLPFAPSVDRLPL